MTQPPIAGVLLMASLLLLGSGLAAAAGYQLVVRAMRPPDAFRGPSPLLVFGLHVCVSGILSLVLLALGLSEPLSNPAGFLVASVTLLFAYVLVVWLFGVRSGALRWHDMGLPSREHLSRWVGDAGVGMATMAVAWPLVTMLAALLAFLLDTGTAQVLPPSRTPLDIALLAVGAGLLVPIGEELFFRGYALTAWLRDLGPRSALIRSTIFFAVAHVLTISAATFDEGLRQAVLMFAVIAPVGLLLGWLFLRRGLIASIAGHTTFNLIGVLLISLAQNLDLPQPPT